VIDGRIGRQRQHIPFVRQLIDDTECICNSANQTDRKYFLMLVHLPPEELYNQSCYPSIFLHHWDFHFFDTCVPGSAFHLQKIIQMLSSSYEQQQEPFDNILCDLNALFDDCLWEFCSRIQILLQELPKEMFKDKVAHEFYKRNTSVIRRVQCLKEILQRSSQLQKRIVNIYHEHLSTKKNSFQKIYQMIYQISKAILCGTRFDGLVDSIQFQTRVSFTNFVSNIFKLVVNDYGLETLSKLATTRSGFDTLLNLIDYSSFGDDDNDDKKSDIVTFPTTQGIFQLVTHYSCIPQTPLYHLFHQRVKSHADEIKLKSVLKQNEKQGL
jgi:hypothetical protein